MVPQLHNSDATPDAVYRNMFAARKSVFIDLLRWDLPALEDRYEIDQFDTRAANYVILSDHDLQHLASARLLPTTEPHILDSCFAVLCENGPPRGATIVEISRFCLDRSLRAAERRQVRDTLIVALVDHALHAGTTSYTAIAELDWAQQILAFGWRCAPLGMPRRIGGKLLIALQIEIAADTPALLSAAGIRSQMATADRREAA